MQAIQCLPHQSPRTHVTEGSRQLRPNKLPAWAHDPAGWCVMTNAQGRSICPGKIVQTWTCQRLPCMSFQTLAQGGWVTLGSADMLEANRPLYGVFCH